MIYLDYAANYPVKKEVLEELNNVELNYYGNANSLHKMGMYSHNELEKLESNIRNTLKISENYDIIYTSSASEANNLAIKGIAYSYNGFGKHILISGYEHNSVEASVSYLKNNGFEIDIIKNNSNGKVDLIDLKDKLRNDTILVCIIMVDSELGAYNNPKEINEILKDYPNCHLLMDSTQAVCKFDIDFNEIEMTSFTPHKFGGLVGTGVLIKRKSTILIPLIHGGKSNTIYRAGSIPLGLIASISKSIEIGYKNIEENVKYVTMLNQYFKSNISNIKNIVINSFDCPYIINISILDKKASDVVKYLSDNDICVSQKSACSITNTPSKAVMSVYKDRKRANSSFRISISELTKKEELDYLIIKLKELL